MLIKVPDLNDLQLLVNVATTGSIGQAASELGLTQPSASRRVAFLERTMGIHLLRRGTRGSTLTPSGRAVVDWATTLLHAADQFKDSVNSMGQERDSVLRAAVSMTIAENYAPTWLAQVRDQSPGTTVVLSMGNSSEVMRMVESGEVDLGLVESPRIREPLRSQQIGRDELIIGVLPNHPWASVDEVTPGDLASTGLLMREPGSGTRETVDSALASIGLQPWPALELASNTALKSAALAGLGPVVLPAVALAPELEAGALVEVHVSGITFVRPLTIVWADATNLGREVVNLFLTAARTDRRTQGQRGHMDSRRCTVRGSLRSPGVGSVRRVKQESSVA